MMILAGSDAAEIVWMMPPRWKITTTPMMMRPWI